MRTTTVVIPSYGTSPQWFFITSCPREYRDKLRGHKLIDNFSGQCKDKNQREGIQCSFVAGFLCVINLSSEQWGLQSVGSVGSAIQFLIEEFIPSLTLQYCPRASAVSALHSVRTDINCSSLIEAENQSERTCGGLLQIRRINRPPLSLVRVSRHVNVREPNPHCTYHHH